MILEAIIDEHVYKLNVPDALLTQASDYFDRLDQDMARGWQMSRDWVAEPDRLQRCQIVADKLLTALESENERLGLLMAGYILARLPGVESVELDMHGEIQNNIFKMAQAPLGVPESVAIGAAGMSKLEAMERAGNEITKVFKVGRGYRFSVFDHAAGIWRDGPTAATEQEASTLRQRAFMERCGELVAGACRH